MEDRLLTLREVGEVLRVGYTTITRLVADGTLVSYKVRRLWRVRQSDLDDYLRRVRRGGENAGGGRQGA
ncbi:MAG: helix-turn-helix domain-containing protein [Bacillota bacterium]|nr:helix-turn-helix domain-containing protein [Bacillota bacterium]